MARVGRPTDYRPEFCEVVIKLGALGKSRAQIAAKIGIARSGLARWEEQHAEFRNAMEFARDLALAWWEDQGQDGLNDRSFNAALWSRSMSARFPADYRTEVRAELTGAGGGPIALRAAVHVLSDDELARIAGSGST